MRKLNPNLFPKDGFWFKNGDGVKLAAATLKDLVVRVIAYRKRARQEPGDPANEVVGQICERNPVLCYNDAGSMEVALKKASLKSRVLAWMALARRHAKESKIEFVDFQTSQARAAVCAKCPLNVAFEQGCASCNETQNEIRKEVMGRRVLDQRLMSCLVLGEDMKMAAHMERETVDNGDLPAHCWRKRTL